MRSIISLLIVKKESVKTWINVDWNEIVDNDYVSDSFLLENESKLKVERFLHKNNKLIDKYPEKSDWDKICKRNTPSFVNKRNPDAVELWNDDNKETIDLVLKHSNHLNNNNIGFLFTYYDDPRLSDLLIRNIGKVSDAVIASCPNPYLTDYIITNWKKLPKDKFWNRNPRLFNLIMNDPDVDWTYVSERTEVEFAEFLIKNKEHLYWKAIVVNHNSGLTKFIIENESMLDLSLLILNRNPELMDLKIKNINKLDRKSILTYHRNADLLLRLDRIHLIEWMHVFKNPNPKLTDLITSTVCSWNNQLSENTNKKLEKYKYERRDRLNHSLLSKHHNILELDKKRNNSIIDSLI